MKKNRIGIFLLGVVLMFCSLCTFAEDSTVSDGIIVTKLESKIMLDPSLSVFKIAVNSHNGVVYLSGNVNSESDATAAVQLAQSTDGVVDVDVSNLKVKNSNHPLDDAVITAKVKGMFIKNKLFNKPDISAMTINVETNNGTVYLSGTSENQKQIDNAVKIAKSVKGVKNVVSRVEPEQLSQNAINH